MDRGLVKYGGPSLCSSKLASVMPYLACKSASYNACSFLMSSMATAGPVLSPPGACGSRVRSPMLCALAQAQCHTRLVHSDCAPRSGVHGNQLPLRHTKCAHDWSSCTRVGHLCAFAAGTDKANRPVSARCGAWFVQAYCRRTESVLRHRRRRYTRTPLALDTPPSNRAQSVPVRCHGHAKSGSRSRVQLHMRQRPGVKFIPKPGINLVPGAQFDVCER